MLKRLAGAGDDHNALREPEGLRLLRRVAQRAAIVPCLLLLGGACGRTPAAIPTSSSGAERCAVAADANDPLVTEWSAAEKANLESLISRQVVGVEYVGCELRVVSECQLPGRYAWNLTTLATDTVEIENADELYAKLPLGAVTLESELERSGYLAVQTTVAGQLRIENGDVDVPNTSGCSRVTHWVRALSVGAFKLFSGDGGHTGTRVGGAVEGRAGASEEQSVLREAGVRSRCADATEETASPHCASPVQLFLEPAGRKERDERMAQARESGAILVSLAAPESEDQSWTLRNDRGEVLCATPCKHWVTPASGYYLQSETTAEEDAVQLPLPASFPSAPGQSLEMNYRGERGAPFTSKVLFIGLGVPLAVTGLMFMGFGIDAYAQDECDDDCQFERDALLPMGVAFLGSAAGLYLWFDWSQESAVEVSAPESEDRGVLVGPGVVRGRF